MEYQGTPSGCAVHHLASTVQLVGHTGMGKVFTFARGVVEYRAGKNVTTTLETHVEQMLLFVMTSLSRSEMMGHKMNVKYNYRWRLMKLCLICAFMIFARNNKLFLAEVT